MRPVSVQRVQDGTRWDEDCEDGDGVSCTTIPCPVRALTHLFCAQEFRVSFYVAQLADWLYTVYTKACLS
jgi:hypothetical protein